MARPDKAFCADPLLTDPSVEFGELIGGAILVTVAWRYGLYRWAALKRFLRAGRLRSPDFTSGTSAAS